MGITSRAQEPFETKLSHLLKLLREAMHMDIAIVSRVENRRYEIYALDAPDTKLLRGARFDLGMTYCEHTLEKNYVTSFHHASEDQQWVRHPALEAFALEAYIGSAIHVGEVCFGTLNFSSSAPRHVPFSTDEHNLVAWTAQWIGRELAQLHKHERLQHEVLLLKQSVASARDHAMNTNAFQQRLMQRLFQELQMPLRGIASLSMQLVDEPTLDTPRATHRLETIHTQSTHMLDVLSQVFKATDNQQGTHVPHTQCFSLYTVLEEVATLLAPMAHQKGLYLDICLGAMLPDDVCSDPVRLRQILMNMLGESIQRTTQGGIFVRCSLDNWQPEDEEACLCIDIQDTSNEVPPAILAQQDSLAIHTTQASIGVEIATNLVHMLGGKISHTSHGSHCFERHIEIPLKLTAASILPMPEEHQPSTWISCVHMPLYQSLEMSCARYGAHIVDRVEDAQLCLVDSAQPDITQILSTLREQAPLAKIYLLIEPFGTTHLDSQLLDGTLDKPLRQSQIVDLFMQASPPRHMPHPMTTTLSMELDMEEIGLGEWLLPPSFEELDLLPDPPVALATRPPHTAIGVPASTTYNDSTPELHTWDVLTGLVTVQDSIYQELSADSEDFSLFHELNQEFFMQGAHLLSTARKLSTLEEFEAMVAPRITELHQTARSLGLPRVHRQCEHIAEALAQTSPQVDTIKALVQALGDELNDAFEATQILFKSARKAS